MRKILYISTLLVGFLPAAEMRTWTDVQGRKIQASLTNTTADGVTLKLADGREVPYPLEKLSPEDRKYVEQAKASLPQNLPGKEPDDISKKFNFTDPWPERVKFSEDPEILTIEEKAEEKKFIYESANYRYVCDVRLSKTVVKGFAVLFEATHLYCRTLPLAINGGPKINGKYQIILFENESDYHAAGGPEGTAGVFIGGKGVVLVPLESLGVRKVGSGYMVDHDKDNSTISHELTHQLTPDPYFNEGAMGWFTEGIAEYVGTTPYRSGAFSVRGNQKPIVDYVTGYGTKDHGGRALGTDINMPPLKNFMFLSYAAFQERPQFSYGCGLLLTYYFLHLDGEGDGKRMKAFLKALHDGAEGQKAVDVLLDGRTYEQLQEDFSKAWGRHGVKFTFSK